MVTPKRILLLGAETDLGSETASALADSGHTLALIASSPDAESAFAVQRLARKLNAAASQAIDARNDTAVRVMVRQVSKQLGGLDAAVLCVENEPARTSLAAYAGKEKGRGGPPSVIDAARGDDVHSALAAPSDTA